MDSVYVLEEYDGEMTNLLGVFTSMEIAEESAKKLGLEDHTREENANVVFYRKPWDVSYSIFKTPLNKLY